jgi:hypothetical protein
MNTQYRNQQFGETRNAGIQTSPFRATLRTFAAEECPASAAGVPIRKLDSKIYRRRIIPIARTHRKKGRSRDIDVADPCQADLDNMGRGYRYGDALIQDDIRPVKISSKHPGIYLET